MLPNFRSASSLTTGLRRRGSLGGRQCQVAWQAWTQLGRPHKSKLHAAATQPSLQDPIENAGLSEKQQQQLHTYLDYMLEINKTMNLTAVRDPDEAWQRHIGDSLALLPIMDKHLSGLTPQSTRPARDQSLKSTKTSRPQGKGARGRNKDVALDSQPQILSPSMTGTVPGDAAVPISTQDGSDLGLRVIDVGTGAGLPGMVLAIARPQWKVTLLDSLRKRCDFLTQAAERAGVSNVNVVWSRAEDAGQNPDLREMYDVAVARAVAETRVLAELCLPFVRVGGLWFAAKGPEPQVEVQAAGPAIDKLGAKLLSVELVHSFSAEGQRTAVVANKLTTTPVKFPRKPGTPNNQPL